MSKTYIAIQYPCWGKGTSPALAKAMLAKAAGTYKWKQMKASGQPHIYESDDPDIYVNEEGFLAYKTGFPDPVMIQEGKIF